MKSFIRCTATVVASLLAGAATALAAGPRVLFVDDSELLRLLDEQGEQGDRRAHYACVIVLMRHGEDPEPLIAEGAWHGEIWFGGSRRHAAPVHPSSQSHRPFRCSLSDGLRSAASRFPRHPEFRCEAFRHWRRYPGRRGRSA